MNIEKTNKTPQVKFENGTLEIKGVSIPNNTVQFFSPIIKEVEKYCLSPKKITTIIIYLEYINTASSKCLLDIFKQFEKLKKTGSEVKVEWHYEQDDEEMLEYGEDYEAIINLPFEFKENEIE